MECLHPLLIPLVIDGHKYSNHHWVPCGKCYACKQRVQKDWIFRLQQEERQCKQAIFVTYTYDDSHCDLTPEGVPTVCKRTVQLYVKRLRKRLPYGSLRYYFCSEYGTHTLRPHYHAILFNYSDLDLRDLVALDWNCGFTYIGTVTGRSINYVTKYVLKDGQKPEGAENTFALMSTRPALGSQYIENYDVFTHHVNHPYLTLPDGTKQHLPRYYRNKVFGEHFLYTVPMKETESMEELYRKIHPNGSIADFQRWKQERIDNYEQIQIKKQKHKHVL